jgi:hypothetical protein
VSHSVRTTWRTVWGRAALAGAVWMVTLEPITAT